jgi:Uma2 family endonuclease
MTIATPISIPITHLQLAPGSLVTITDVSWEQFEAILVALGEHRRTRIVYVDGTLEIMSPLPAHERPNRIIADLVKVFLDSQERQWEDFGSTTFKRQKKSAGLEPDTCFYIDQNAERVRDCMRMDLEVYPPADLAIEADVTSKTTMEAYQRIGIPEVWIYDSNKLTIHCLEADQYKQVDRSPIFPDLSIATLIPQLLQQALTEGTSQMLRNLRKQMSH